MTNMKPTLCLLCLAVIIAIVNGQQWNGQQQGFNQFNQGMGGGAGFNQGFAAAPQMPYWDPYMYMPPPPPPPPPMFGPGPLGGFGGSGMDSFMGTVGMLTVMNSVMPALGLLG